MIMLLKKWLPIGIVCALISVTTQSIAHQFYETQSNENQLVQTPVRGLPNFADLAEVQGKAVVNISTTQTRKADDPFAELDNSPFGDLFRLFGGGGMRPQQPREYKSRSLGSGFIVDSNGYILTNAHVIDYADEITVKLADKREFKAKVVGSDKRTDVAVLKVEASGLPFVRIGNPNKLRVGEWVVAIGSPYGFENTVTAGIVSAKGRSMGDDDTVPFIQSDVAVNPGNSGGPLFNMNGEVVGVNSRIYSGNGGFVGLSFSIPIDLAMNIVEQLRKDGKVSRGRMGVGIQDVSAELAPVFGLDKPTGALITGVEPNSAADKAGIRADDIVLRFNGAVVENAADLRRMVSTSKPNSRIPLEIYREGRRQTVSVVLGEANDNASSNPQQESPSDNTKPKLGLRLKELSDAELRQLDVPFGLYVMDTSGAASEAGIQAGDVIVGVGNRKVQSFKEFDQLVKNLKTGDTIALRVRRGDGIFYVPLKLK